jgi:radical SAM protein with 4Fe4S-binding SPASM domain
VKCPHMPEISAREFVDRVARKRDGDRIPWMGSMEVTSRCNLRCLHCYINLPVNDTEAQHRELPGEEFCEILNQAADEGCFWLQLTGGEPFVRPDFLKIYSHAKTKGFLIALFTNATTVTPRIADYLAEWPPHSLEITLYARTQPVYERVTRAPGSYKRCMEGIELLLERKLPVELKTAVLNENKEELFDIKAYAEQLGVKFRFDATLNHRLDLGAKPGRHRLSPAEVVDLDLKDEGRSEKLKEFYVRAWRPPLESRLLYHCGAGSTSFHVDAYGHLSPCIMSRAPSYDLRSGTFRHGWREFMTEVLSQERTRDTQCTTCHIIDACGQCPGHARLETGDQEAPVEFLCQIAHLRASAFGLDARMREVTT